MYSIKKHIKKLQNQYFRLDMTVKVVVILNYEQNSSRKNQNCTLSE